MSNEKMSADEALKVLQSLLTPKANQSGGRPPIPAPGAEEKRANAIEFFAALIAERDAMRKMAARYEYMRSPESVFPAGLSVLTGEALDSAIDAEIASAQS